MADKKTDPKNADPETLPVSEADDAGQKGKFKDNPDKPDKTTIAQVQVLGNES
jgi:hypothetical protein